VSEVALYVSTAAVYRITRKQDNTDRVMNKRKVSRVEGKATVIKQTESGKNKADVFWEFGLVNSAIQTICKQNQRY
jgi:hypothetical protein